MRFAILLGRENDEEEFECKVTIGANGDWKTVLGGLVGSAPRDDPILFDPVLPPTNKLRKAYDIENLGSLDLDEFVEIEFDKPLKKKSELSDSGSDSGSPSGNSVPCRRPSVQHQDENEVKQIDGAEDIKEQTEESGENAEEAVSDSNPSTAAEAETRGEALQLVWQELLQESNADNQATEARLIDFVVIPGVYGNSTGEELGPSPGSGSSAWVTKFAEEGGEKPKSPQSSCRVFRFGYNSSELFSGHRSREAIQRIALRLLNGLRSKRCSETQKRLIYFIGHDIGGIIVKDALITASLDRNSWQDISEMTRVLIFNGCPHRQKDSFDLETRLASFLYENYSRDFGKTRPSAASISGLTKAMIQVNGLFIASHVALRCWIINLHSYGSNSNGCFDAYSATLGVPLEKRLPAPTGEEYASLTQYLAKIEPDVREPKESIGPRQYAQERKLLALASPIYPLRNRVESNPLVDLTDYKSWINSPCPQILYLHGSHRARDVAESVFYALEDEATKVKRRENVLYFSFNRFDVRANSIRDMIATFLAQICNHHPKLGPAVNRLCSQIENEKGWTEIDLIQFFEMVRISAEVEQTMIVINHFDECTKGSRKRFLDHITDKYYNEETPWKIVVTSNEPDALSEELSGPFCVPIHISSGELGDLVMDSFESDIQALISSRGDINFREEQIRDELRFMEKLDPPVRHIICEQLRVREEWPDEISTGDALGLLSLSQQAQDGDKNMVSVLYVVLKRYPDQNSLECLLSWLLYAVRPLTIWELATIVSFSDERECNRVSPSFMAVDRLVENVEKDFAGILEVDHNEVRFKHPCLHEIMVSGDPSTQNGEEKEYPWNKIKDKAHSLIQRMCLDYVSRDTVQEYVRETLAVADSTTFETPPFPDRTNLVSYAVQAWVHHYSLISPLPDLSALSSKKDLVQILAKAQWCLANPATRRSPCFQSLFPIFTGLGILNVVEPLGSDDTLRGLVEAASKAQIQVVEDLLSEYDFTPIEIWEVLKAASSSGNEELMNNLLDKIEAKGNIPKEFEWPPVLIYRAANLGLEGFAKRILSLGCPPDPDIDWRNETSIQASPLCQAACHGYTNIVRVLLKHGASMEFTSLSGRNALHKAALEGHTETVKVILEESQVNIDCTSESNSTPLYLAVLRGNHDTVKLLLEKGADPNMGISDTYTGDDQWTPLVAAIDDGFKKCIGLLLDNGANTNLPGPSGPPLHWAVIRGRVDVLDMLLEAGANPRSELLKEPLLFSAVGAELEGAGLAMLQRLLELKLDVNGQDSDGVTALLVALVSYPRQGFEGTSLGPTDGLRDAAVKMLLEHGADPNHRPSSSYSPLMRAVSAKQYRATEMLLEVGADPNKKPLERLPPLISAVYIPQIARLLLKHGAHPETGSKDGWTPLAYAAYKGYTETVEVVLEYGASVDTPFGAPIEHPARIGSFMELCEKSDLTGMTPVMFAAWQGHDEIVRLLAEAGADLQRTGGIFEDEPPVLFSSSEVLSALLEFPTRIDLNVTDRLKRGALHRQCTTVDGMRRLINAGADIELTESTGNTPLGLFAGSDLEKVKLLVKRGANINHMSPWEGSPLHQACKIGFSDSIRFLVENGADLTSVHPYKGTPLQTLCAPEEAIDALQHEEMVRYLVSEYKKQSVDITTQSGIFGYLANAAAFGSPRAILSLILEQEGIKVDVRDDMGRMPVHFAACNGLPSFNDILERGGDVNAKDKQGRMPLHWAVQAGKLQVVKKIILLMDDKLEIDIPDIDGWTPLCWALRGALPLTQAENVGEPSLRLDVVKLLIEKGVKTAVAVSYKEETWAPLDIARYHSGDPEIISLLENDLETTNKDGAENSDKDDATSKAQTVAKKGVRQDSAFCDYCLSQIYGLYWGCETCEWFCLCYKCYQHVDILHPAHNNFEQKGEEEFEEIEGETSTTANSESSDKQSNSGSDSEGSEGEDGEGDS
ncbi:hypothetical protein FOMA001_g9127 [Fusarium oxysporum f. sp. matthiolae]|nr:hypothetical protein FOMA001_g9127 [Fusarium oxysporum f. sp. matthiolae]